MCSYWISHLHTRASEDHSCVLLDSWRTRGVRMVPLSLMELRGRWLGKRSCTIDDYMLIDQNRSLSCQSQWILESVFTIFSRLLFLHAHREASALSNELPEKSDQFRFLRAACLANIKGSVGLILAKVSVMLISIPLDLSSRPFIPLPCFIRSRCATPLLAPSLVFFPRNSA